MEKTYHNFRVNNIIDYGLISSIFIDSDDLWIAGRYIYRRGPACRVV